MPLVTFTYIQGMRRLRFCFVIAIAAGCLNLSVSATAACQTSKGSAFATNSEISDNQVLVCASANSSSVTSTKPAAPKPIRAKSTATPVAPKSACPKSVATTEQIVAAALQGCEIPGPVRVPEAPSSPVARTVKPVLARVDENLRDQTLVSAEPVQIIASATRVSVGQSVWLNSSAMSHERTAVVLGRRAYVKFEPASQTWSDQQGNQEGRIVAFNFANAGPKRITLTASYEASYRFSLTGPWQKIGRVFSTDSVAIEVIEPLAAVEVRQTPRLVFGTCVTHASDYRC